MDNNVCNIFITQNKENALKLYDYIHDELGISEVTKIYYNNGNFYSLVVREENYRKAIINGHRFAYDNNMTDVFWIDSSNCFEKVGCLQIAYMVMDKNVKGNIMWGLDKHLPKDIKLYLKELENYLGVSLFRTCVNDDENYCFVIVAKGMDYEKYMERLDNFINEYGVGPFIEIIPLDECGNFEEYAYFEKKTKIKELSKNT